MYNFLSLSAFTLEEWPPLFFWIRNFAIRECKLRVTMCRKFRCKFHCKIWSRSLRNISHGDKIKEGEPPKSSKNQFQMVPGALLGMMWVPKSIKEGTRSSLEDYVGPLIDKKWVLNSKKVARSLQEKPTCSEIWGKLQHLFRFLSMPFFNQFCSEFSRLRTCKKWFSPRRNINFCKIDVLRKTNKNH